MEVPTTRAFLVTANIASCFEEPKEMLNPWLDEFFKAVVEHSPKFIAIHCQEVGGKNYETSMAHVDQFVKNLMARAKSHRFSRAQIFLDEDFTCAERFTALGNLYLVHESLKNAAIWDFKDKVYKDVEGVEEYFGDIEDVPIKEKAKFPQEFFPECKWSRKGFMRTRWRLNGTQFDFINIHLFHDASNFIAMEKFPSVYTLNRKRAMEHTLDRFHNDEYDNVPFFIFGDFNFRLDTGSVVQILTRKCSEEELEISGEKTCEYKDEEGKTLLSVSKKGFKHFKHHSLFLNDESKWLRPFDKELLQFSERLSEFPITFPPSYPFEEGVTADGGHLYMQTRCPSWCDRVILSNCAKNIIEKTGKEVRYSLIGLNTNMGDHKPVGLRIELPQGSGIINCCFPNKPCPNFVHNPSAPCFADSAWCSCLDYPKCPALIIDANDSETGLAFHNADTTNALLRDHACTKDRQCVCSIETNDGAIPHSGQDEKINKMLKNILNLKNEDLTVGEKSDSILKRVHSDPIKVKSFAQKQMGIEMPHSTLAHSYSLDSPCKGKNSKLKLRATSSRLISHHSSSTEEWFEEVPDKAEPEKEEQIPLLDNPGTEQSQFPSLDGESIDNHSSADARELSFLSEDSSAALVDLYGMRKRYNQDFSLNNLLISDSYEGQLDEIDSVSKSSALKFHCNRVPSHSDQGSSLFEGSSRRLQSLDSASRKSTEAAGEQAALPLEDKCCCTIL